MISAVRTLFFRCLIHLLQEAERSGVIPSEGSPHWRCDVATALCSLNREFQNSLNITRQSVAFYLDFWFM